MKRTKRNTVEGTQRLSKQTGRKGKKDRRMNTGKPACDDANGDDRVM